jgi:hypothetical protein
MFADLITNPEISEPTKKRKREDIEVEKEDETPEKGKTDTTENHNEEEIHTPEDDPSIGSELDEPNKDDDDPFKRAPPTPPLLMESILLHEMDHSPETPSTLHEAFTGPQSKEWKEGHGKEMKGLLKLNVFRKITEEEMKIFLQHDTKIFQNHSIFKLKKDESGNVARYKVRCVIQGCNMKKGVHYHDTFSPCTRLETIRLMIALAVQRGWKLTHADVPNAYLHGKLENLVFTHIPYGWNEVNGYDLGRDGDPVVLDKALYGTPDAGRAWNKVIDIYLKSLGYIPSAVETALYHHPDTGSIIALWVDDIFITGPSADHIKETLNNLYKEYEVKTLGTVSYALGIYFQPLKDGSYFLSQTAQIENIVTDCNMDVRKKRDAPFPFRYNATKADCPRNEKEIEEMKKVPYRTVLGKLLYIAMATRPDILFAVVALSRFANNPGKVHWELMKQIVQYTVNTKNMGLLYTRKSDDIILTAHTDASYNSDPDQGLSTLVHCLDVNGCCWMWNSTMSKTIPQNAQHAEILAGSRCLMNLKWASYLLDHMGIKYEKPIPMKTDSQSKIATMENPCITKNSRHIRPKNFDLRKCREEGMIRFVHTRDGELCADQFTKSLVGKSFAKFRGDCSVHLLPNASDQEQHTIPPPAKRRTAVTDPSQDSNVMA